jgi:resuscitation-promoting factor RpfB
LTVVLTALSLILLSPQHYDHRWRTVRPYNAKLERMAYCEWGYSKPHWFGNTGNGFYGGLQFTLSTWKSVGGRNYPHRNSKLEQKYRAVILIKKNHGYGDWPICGSA